MTSTANYPQRVGELRPSQLLWSLGVGALIDLPHMSVITRGIDEWDDTYGKRIHEPRLLNAVQGRLGSGVTQLMMPPIDESGLGSYDPRSDSARIGVPVSPFPEYLRCPFCQVLAPVSSGLFVREGNPWRPDTFKYTHINCQRANKPTAYPARMLVACENGHLDDFPWSYYVHRGAPHDSVQLTFFEVGASLETANLFIKCETCDAPDRSMVEAFNRQNPVLPSCRGRHPHLSGRYDKDCDAQLRAVLLGASNGWFPITESVLSIPTAEDELDYRVEQVWSVVGDLESVREVTISRRDGLDILTQYTDDEIFDSIERRRDQEEDELEPDQDLKTPEWNAFSNPVGQPTSSDFSLEDESVPSSYTDTISAVVLAHRLREVNALVGFARIQSPDELIGDEDFELGPLTRQGTPSWVPTTEVRGEGVFIRLNPEALRSWIDRPDVQTRTAQLREGHELWRSARNLPDTTVGFPGPIYYLVHTMAHLLIREFAIECGYGAASLGERIYTSPEGDDPDIAGFMLYTAAADSEGTLGGLIELGKTGNIQRLLTTAITRAGLCSSDPLCAEHDASSDRTLHGAACHACTFASETSCEVSNRYLDRAFVAATFAGGSLGYFDA